MQSGIAAAGSQGRTRVVLRADRGIRTEESLSSAANPPFRLVEDLKHAASATNPLSGAIDVALRCLLTATRKRADEGCRNTPADPEELLDIVDKAVEAGSGDATSPEDEQLAVEDAIVRALMMWASRGNPVSRATDTMIERAVRTAMARARF